MNRKVSIRNAGMQNLSALTSTAAKLGLKLTSKGSRAVLEGPSLYPCEVDLKTGEFSGDSDNETIHNKIRQRYAVENTSEVYAVEGFIVENENILPDGSIVVDYYRALPYLTLPYLIQKPFCKKRGFCLLNRGVGTEDGYFSGFLVQCEDALYCVSGRDTCFEGC